MKTTIFYTQFIKQININLSFSRNFKPFTSIILKFHKQKFLTKMYILDTACKYYWLKYKTHHIRAHSESYMKNYILKIKINGKKYNKIVVIIK